MWNKAFTIVLFAITLILFIAMAVALVNKCVECWPYHTLADNISFAVLFGFVWFCMAAIFCGIAYDCISMEFKNTDEK